MNLKLAGAIAIAVMGCGGSKHVDKTTPGGGNGPDTGKDAAVGVPVPVDTQPAAPPPPPDTGGFALIKPDALTWNPLNPSGPGPELAVVHGDAENGGAFFLRVPPGGHAGLHSHTNDYWAVVVSGTPRHWLPGGEKKAKPLASGSFWFQPGGQPHDDDCKSAEPCVLFLVMKGKFDMAPQPKAKPIKKPGAYSLVERKAAKFNPFDPSKPDGLKAAILNGDPTKGPVAFIVEVPPGGNSGLHHHTSDYHAVVLDGAPAHWLPFESGEGEALTPGTYWFQPGGYDHGDRCTSSEPCHAFIFMDGLLDATPAEPLMK